MLWLSEPGRHLRLRRQSYLLFLFSAVLLSCLSALLSWKELRLLLAGSPCLELRDSSTYGQVELPAGKSSGDAEIDEQKEYSDAPFRLLRVEPDDAPRSKLGGEPPSEPSVPVLFVHGHRGSFNQANALAVAAAWRKALLPEASVALRVYTIDFAGASSAFHPGLLRAQAAFIGRSIEALATLHNACMPVPTATEEATIATPRFRDADCTRAPVIVLAHSMGGVAARLALADLPADGHALAPRVPLLVTLNSPLADHPFDIEAGMHGIYEQLHSHQSGSQPLLLSVHSGHRDFTVATHLTTPAGRANSGFWLGSESMPGAWAGCGHDGIVNCGSVVAALAAGLDRFAAAWASSPAVVRAEAASAQLVSSITTAPLDALLSGAHSASKVLALSLVDPRLRVGDHGQPSPSSSSSSGVLEARCTEWAPLAVHANDGAAGKGASSLSVAAAFADAAVWLQLSSETPADGDAADSSVDLLALSATHSAVLPLWAARHHMHGGSEGTRLALGGHNYHDAPLDARVGHVSHDPAILAVLAEPGVGSFTLLQWDAKALREAISNASMGRGGLAGAGEPDFLQKQAATWKWRACVGPGRSPASLPHSDRPSLRQQRLEAVRQRAREALGPLPVPRWSAREALGPLPAPRWSEAGAGTEPGAGAGADASTSELEPGAEAAGDTIKLPAGQLIHRVDLARLLGCEASPEGIARRRHGHLRGAGHVAAAKSLCVSPLWPQAIAVRPVLATSPSTSASAASACVARFAPVLHIMSTNAAAPANASSYPSLRGSPAPASLTLPPLAVQASSEKEGGTSEAWFLLSPAVAFPADASGAATWLIADPACSWAVRAAPLAEATEAAAESTPPGLSSLWRPVRLRLRAWALAAGRWMLLHASWALAALQAVALLTFAAWIKGLADAEGAQAAVDSSSQAGCCSPRLPLTHAFLNALPWLAAVAAAQGAVAQLHSSSSSANTVGAPAAPAGGDVATAFAIATAAAAVVLLLMELAAAMARSRTSMRCNGTVRYNDALATSTAPGSPPPTALEPAALSLPPLHLGFGAVSASAASHEQPHANTRMRKAVSLSALSPLGISAERSTSSGSQSHSPSASGSTSGRLTRIDSAHAALSQGQAATPTAADSRSAGGGGLSLHRPSAAAIAATPAAGNVGGALQAAEKAKAACASTPGWPLVAALRFLAVGPGACGGANLDEKTAVQAVSGGLTLAHHVDRSLHSTTVQAVWAAALVLCALWLPWLAVSLAFLAAAAATITAALRLALVGRRSRSLPVLPTSFHAAASVTACAGWLLALLPALAVKIGAIIHTAELLAEHMSMSTVAWSIPHPYHSDIIVAVPLLLILLAITGLASCSVASDNDSGSGIRRRSHPVQELLSPHQQHAASVSIVHIYNLNIAQGKAALHSRWLQSASFRIVAAAGWAAFPLGHLRPYLLVPLLAGAAVAQMTALIVAVCRVHRTQTSASAAAASPH